MTNTGLSEEITTKTKIDKRKYRPKFTNKKYNLTKRRFKTVNCSSCGDEMLTISMVKNPKCVKCFYKRNVDKEEARRLQENDPTRY